jgi:hypothetical protein
MTSRSSLREEDRSLPKMTKVRIYPFLRHEVQLPQVERGPGPQEHLMLSRASNQDIQAILQDVKADVSTMLFDNMDNAFI